jgi:hypothetical protein
VVQSRRHASGPMTACLVTRERNEDAESVIAWAADRNPIDMRGGLEAMGKNIGDLRDEAIPTSCNCEVC